MADRGFLYGDSVFETLRAEDGVPIFWREHMNRLVDSCRRAEIETDPTRADLPSIVQRCLSINAPTGVARVRITVSSGVGDIDVVDVGSPTWVVTARSYVARSEEQYARGIAVALTDVRRPSAATLDPAIKSGNYAASLRARRIARRAGADEAILLSSEGWLAEGAISNLFWISGGALETPALSLGVLPGVTRAKVCALAARGAEGVRLAGVREVASPPDRIEQATEVFVTNSLWEVLGVARWNGRSVAGGEAGPITIALRTALRETYPG